MDASGEDFQSLPLLDRLQHKLWKARVSAYDELTNLFHKTDNDADFYTYEEYLKKMATDANAVAQEAGLKAVYEYVENAPNAAASRETLIPALVEKCLGAAKAGTKQKATDIILLYVEIDVADPVVELVLPGLSAKQPKLVTQCVVVLRELVRQFGIKVVSPKPILKVLPKLFGHVDKNVRAETFALTVELYRWLRTAINSYLSDLKPVQTKELEEAFAKIGDDKPKPERLLRSEQALAAAEPDPQEVQMGEAGEEEDGHGEPMEEEPLDPYDLADPVDITSKLPANFYDLLASKKWQERREALDALLESTKTPRIMDKDYSELMGALAKRINDANILLVGTAANCVEAIATGLRQDFGKFKGVITPPIVEKLKERKPAILEQLAKALNAVFASVPLGDIVEDIATATKHKNPQVRSESIKVLSQRLKEIRTPPSKPEIKAFAEMMVKTLDDADANAREASAEGLGTLMKVVGEKPMLPYTDGLDDIKMGKIKEAFEKAQVKVKATPVKKPAPPPPATKRAAPTSKPVRKPKPSAPAPAASSSLSTASVDDPMAVDNAAALSPPKRKPPARLGGGSSVKKPTLTSAKPKPAAAASAAAPKKMAAAKLPPSSGPEEVKYRFSPEEAESRVEEFIPPQIWEDLGQSQWKVRLAAMESLHTHFDTVDAPTIEPEIVIRCLSKKPGGKEMNFQVMGKMFGIMQLLATKCPNFTKSAAAIAIPVLVEKLGDIKLKKPAGECLIMFAEKTSLQFVFSLSYPVWKKAKSPKILADSLIWIHSAIMDFGIAGLQVRDLIDFLKTSLANTNASVRTSAVTVLGALRLYIGPEVKSFVQDVTPALMAIIEAEFDKVAQMEPPQPTKTTADTDAGAAGGDSDALDSLFPRVDISGQLAKASAECNDSNWKIRKEGLEKVLAIIEGANKRIKPNLGDFASVLKQRLNDSNKNLQIMAVDITGLLAVSMGKPFEKYLKPLGGPLTAVLSDNKANVRAAGVAALDTVQKQCGVEPLISTFATSLATDSPTLRKELLTLLTGVFKDDAVITGDLSPLILPLFSCLQDRNAEVRKAAQACLPALVANVGYDAVLHKAADLKVTERQTVLPFVEAVRGTATTSSRPATAASATSATPPTEAKRSTISASNTNEKPASRIKSIARKRPGLPTPRTGTTGTGSAAANAASSSANTPAQGQCPVTTSDPRAKLVRAKKENRWQFDTPRSDIIDTLRTLCEANMSAEVCSLMFSTSQYAEKDRLSGLALLDDCIATPEYAMQKYGLDYADVKQRYLANADLIFKYLTIRFFDTNTSMLIKSLDLTQHLVTVLDEEGYHLTEYEAVSFLPFLINKVGDPKEVMRARVRAIFKSICRIYPASKLFNYLLDAAANSKNAKTRAECLEEVGAIVQRNGMSVMLANKSLPLIATHIGDRDAGVRNAALNAIAQAYILIGDSVMKYVSRLGEKEKGMLEERLKRTKPSPSVIAAAEKEARLRQEAEEMEVDELPFVNQLPGRSHIGKPRSAMQAPAPVQRSPAAPAYEPEAMEDVTDDYGQNLDPPQRGDQRTMTGTGSVRSQRSAAHQAFQQALQEDRREYIVDYLIAQITSGDVQSSIEALKQLDKLLSSKPELILPDVNNLVNAITLQVRLAYSAVDPRSPTTTRLCKYLVNALVVLFANRDLASVVSQDALSHLLQELAHRLLDHKMLALESGMQFSKALNVTLVKVLENSQRNVMFSALLSILSSSSASLRPGDSPTGKETKYCELIMKCLWKLAKPIQENLRNGMLDPDQLIYDINKFFVMTPPYEWKRRAADKVPLGELPLRTVRTMLLELVNCLGESIYHHLTLIEDPSKSAVYPYLHHMLDAGRKNERSEQQQASQASPRSQLQHASAGDNRFYAHSRNSSLSRPGSMASVKSNGFGMMRTSSGSSMQSGESQGEGLVQVAGTPEAGTSQSPRMHSPVISHQVQPMQIDEPNDGPRMISDYEANNLLTPIFAKIGTRDQTKQGIIELYEFQKKYPCAEAKVNAYLSETGTYFQSYIRRGLSNLAAEDNQLRANVHTAAAQDYSQQSSPNTSMASAMAISPMATHNAHQDPRQSLDSLRSPASDRSSIYGGDDAAEIKQRLLKLQQKFGYKTETSAPNEENGSSVGGSSMHGESGVQRQDISPTYGSLPSRRMSPLNQDSYSSLRSSLHGESDRAQSVSALKERLAKMKQVIHSAASSASDT